MTGRGTYGEPWDLATALNTDIKNTGVDQTIWIKSLAHSHSRCFGGYGGKDAGHPIVVKPYGDSKLDGSIELSSDHMIVRDLEIYDGDFLTRISQQTGSSPTDIPLTDGLRNDVKTVKFINCVIHDCRQGILSSDTIEINGCVIYYNGWDAPDRGHGHGIYASSSGDGLIIKDCIIFQQFGWGIHAYGSPPASLFNITLDGNICFENGAINNYPTDNILLGGTSGTYPKYCTVKNNTTYYAGNSGKNQLGYGAAGIADSNIYDNTFVGGQYALELIVPWGEIGIAGNKFYGPVTGFTPETYPDNVYSSNVPDLVIVRPNDYQSDRAHVAVYNGLSLDNVEIDLSTVAGLNVGDTVTAWNVQAGVGNDLQSLTLDTNKHIVIDMREANRSVATPQGWIAPDSTFPKFGAFVLEKLVS